MHPPDLDIENPAALLAYLSETGRLREGEQPRIEVLRGGVSNRTVLVERAGGEAWVLKQALPKLRVAVDWFSPPERIGREAEGMRWLARLLPPGSVPALVFEDPAHHLLAMQAIPGRRTWKSVLLAGQIETSLVEQFARMLAAIHSGGAVPQAREAFADRSWFESLRLEPYYTYTATQVPQAAAFLAALVEETRRERHTIVHGDYSPKNILVHDGRLVLLDHEVIHFGDPAFDVGFSLAHLLSKAHHVASRRREFAAAAHLYWSVYAGTAGASAAHGARSARHTLGCLLARVAGRSPLEYLTAQERARQQAAVVELIGQPVRGVPELIGDYLGRLS